MPKELKAWSFSRYNLYSQCPLKFKLQALEGNRPPPSPAMDRGRKIHEQAANFITRQGSAPDVKHHVDLMGEIRDMKGAVVEQQWGFTRNWSATGWFSSDTWLRSVLDVGLMYDDNTAEVVDWKTGKRYGDNQEQMTLFAASVFCKWKPVTHVTTRLAYVDGGGFEFGEFKRSDLEALISDWERKVAPMFTDKDFLPKPSGLCKFCHFSKSSGGPCRYG